MGVFNRSAYAVLLVASLLAVSLVFAGSTKAATSSSVQSYSAQQRLDRGTIVALGDDNQLIVATAQSSKQVLGVVVDHNSLPTRVDSGDVKNQTYVASTGTFPMLVSTQNGVIEPGDYVTLSAISGVAMLADSEQEMVVGRAQIGFAGQANRLSQVDLKDASGQVIKKADLGIVPVTIEIAKNPNTKSTKTALPDFLERIGQQIAEKTVSPVRMYLSVAIAGISLIIALTILVAGVRQSILSIGRNPLSKRSIIFALVQVILTSFIILIIGLFAVYLLLRL